MDYILINTLHNSIVDRREFDNPPPVLTPEKKLKWYELKEIKPTFDNRFQRLQEIPFLLSGLQIIVEYQAVNFLSVEQAAQKKIEQTYTECEHSLNSYSVGYGASEIATWPFMKQEVVVFNSTGTIGPFMQANIAFGLNSAESLAVKITSLAAAENAVLKTRYDRLKMISSAIETGGSVSDILDLF